MKAVLFILLFVITTIPVKSQEYTSPGSLTGGLESNSALYTDGGLGSNNYLKLDYVKGRLSMGTQLEWYPMPLSGFPKNLKGFGVPIKYFSWTDDVWGVTVGDFYEQLGNGLILRSWEDRNLGWNNSIGGVLSSFRTLKDLFVIKAFWGVPRKGLWYGDYQVGGLSATFFWKGITIEGNVANRIDHGHHMMSWSVVPSFSFGGFSVKGEYAHVGEGNAEIIEANFAARRFSSSLTLRRLERMDDSYNMNYLPALCQEQSYILASLNPYTTFASGEAGFVADAYYSLKTWKFHVNGSMIYALPKALNNYDVFRLCYRDINIDVEKRWSNRLKTIAFVSIQENSPSHGERKSTDAQNVFVLDALYRVNHTLSLRCQVQYLYSQELTRDWMAALLELGIAPKWSFHASDMYNHGDTKEHYYEAGLSYTLSSFRLTLSYGHQRAGFICSGGVCRWQPEYTGGLLCLNYQF